MKYKYSKYTGNPLDDLDLDDLVEKLSDLLLSSGFQSPYGGGYGESDDDRTMQALHDAIMDALFNGGVLPEEALERLLGDPADADQADARSKLEQLIQDIIERMMQDVFITPAPDLDSDRAQRQARGPGGGFGPDAPPTRFEVTDKSLDFLGYRALRDLLGSVGKSIMGRHDTRDNSTGIETIAAPTPYEFGDSLNLDPSSTVMNAVQRINRALGGRQALVQFDHHVIRRVVPAGEHPLTRERVVGDQLLITRDRRFQFGGTRRHGYSPRNED